MELETERLRLRRPTEEDLDDVHEVHSDPRTNEYNPAGPVLDVERSRRMLNDWIEHWERHGFGYWTVVRAADDHLVGFSGLMRREVDGQPVLNLYYRFRPEAWGTGYATEVARAAQCLARARFPAERVVAFVRETNTPSARVAERIGLVPEERRINDGEAPTRVYRSPAPDTGPEPGSAAESHRAV